MNLTAFASILLLAFSSHVSAADAASDADAAKTPDAEAEVDISPNKEGPAANVPSRELGNICFFSGNPPIDVKYTVIRKIKAGKGTYGDVRDILPKFAGYAQKYGGDAIIGYTGSQRFGLWPWRMVRPVVRGTAVKWSIPPSQDCAAMGGSTLSSIMATNQPPPH